MKLNNNSTTLYQNKYNIFVGNIESEETIYLDDSFIIIGNISTLKGVVSTEHIIIIGNIEAKSIYADKDFLCIGEVKCPNLQTYGEYKVINKDFTTMIKEEEMLNENDISIKDREKNYENMREEHIDSNDIERIEQSIYSVLEKYKYDIKKIKVRSISKEDDLYRVVIDSPFHNQNNIKIITDKVQLNYKDKRIDIQVWEEVLNVHDEYSVINIGDYIIHKKYGKGEIISRYDDIFTVKFKDGEKDMKGEWIIDSKFISKE